MSKTIQFKKWRLFMNIVGFTFWIFVGTCCFFIGLSDQELGLSISGFVILLGMINPLKHTYKGVINMSPALVLDENGITDNTYFFSVGEIKWEDIKEIKTVRILFLFKFIRIILNNPKFYIKRENNLRKRLYLSLSKLVYKTPVLLDHRLMDTTYDELVRIFDEVNLEDPTTFTDLSKHLID